MLPYIHPMRIYCKQKKPGSQPRNPGPQLSRNDSHRLNPRSTKIDHLLELAAQQLHTPHQSRVKLPHLDPQLTILPAFLVVLRRATFHPLQRIIERVDDLPHHTPIKRTGLEGNVTLLAPRFRQNSHPPGSAA